MDWLRSQRPDLVPRYRELYRRGAYAPREERERLSRLVRWRGRPGGFRSVEPAWPEQPSAAPQSNAPRGGALQETLF